MDDSLSNDRGGESLRNIRFSTEIQPTDPMLLSPKARSERMGRPHDTEIYSPVNDFFKIENILFSR